MALKHLSAKDVAARVARAQSEILALGVQRLALFGSVQRDAAQADSDIDLLVEFAPGAKSYDRFVSLAELLERILDSRVHLITRESLSPFLGPHILAEARDVLRAA
jgi:predicted nucleotidyltransferase